MNAHRGGVTAVSGNRAVLLTGGADGRVGQHRADRGLQVLDALGLDPLALPAGIVGIREGRHGLVVGHQAAEVPERLWAILDGPAFPLQQIVKLAVAVEAAGIKPAHMQQAGLRHDVAAAHQPAIEEMPA